MKYFAMIDGERKGPFTLNELAEAGVTPSTYVWCKEMKDWEKAEEVADICRYFRQRIASLQHPGVIEMPGAIKQNDNSDSRESTTPDDGLTDEQRKLLEEVPVAFREMVRKSGMLPTNGQIKGNPDQPPVTSLWVSVLVTIFCFPIFGFVAIYYSYKTRTLWNQAMKNPDDKDSGELKVRAHDAARKSRLWTGLTISFGIILFGFYLSRALV